MIIVGVVLAIVRNEALIRAALHRDDPGDKVHKLDAVVAVGEHEIDPLLGLLDPYGLVGGLVLEDELLEVEEGAAVGDVLAELDLGDPLVGVGVDLGAGVAEVVVDGEFDEVGLLEDGALADLALDADLDLDSLGVGLGPDELGVDEAEGGGGDGLGEAAEEEGEELLGLEGEGPPAAGGLEVGGAVGAEGQGEVAGEAAGEVGVGAEAPDAHVGGVRGDALAARAAQNGAGGLGGEEHAGGG